MPFHGPNSPISEATLGAPLEEGGEEESLELDPLAAKGESRCYQWNRRIRAGDTYNRQRKAGPSRRHGQVQWTSVVDFDGDWANFHKYREESDNKAKEAIEEIRESMPRWGGVNSSEPPRYGHHRSSRRNKQPKDADKKQDQVRDDNSTDLYWAWTGTQPHQRGSKSPRTQGRNTLNTLMGLFIDNQITLPGGAADRVLREKYHKEGKIKLQPDQHSGKPRPKPQTTRRGRMIQRRSPRYRTTTKKAEKYEEKKDMVRSAWLASKRRGTTGFHGGIHGERRGQAPGLDRQWGSPRWTRRKETKNGNVDSHK